MFVLSDSKRKFRRTVLHPLFLVFILWTGGTSVRAQSAQNVIKTEFKGLKKTNDQTLRRFIQSKPGESCSPEQLHNDEQALLNLRIFSSVQTSVRDTTNAEGTTGVVVTFDCEEILTRFPIFSFGTIGDQTFVKAGYTNANVGGRLGLLRAYYLYYNGHSVYLYQDIPYLNNSSYGLTLDLKRVNTLEPLYMNDTVVHFDYRNNYASILGFYEFRQFHRLKFGLSVFNEQYTPEVADPLLDTIQVYEGLKGSIRLLHTIQNINYKGCTVIGTSNEFTSNLVLTPRDGAFYQVTDVFKYLGEFSETINVGIRLKAGVSSNNTGPFAPYLLDSYLNIRGVGNRIDRGTAQVVTNIEFRHRILNKPKWGAAQWVLFTDIGSWRLPGGSFEDMLNRQNLKMYSGVGGRVWIAKVYNLVLRADLGVNMMKPSERGIVIGLGQYF